MAAKATTERLNYDPTAVGSALGSVQQDIGAVSQGISDVAQAASDTILLALSSAAVAIGTYKTVTGKNEAINNIFGSAQQKLNVGQEVKTEIESLDRFDATKLYSLKIDEYFMPLSQSFTLRAKKRLNVSSLVDGVDIIQQTRKESKTIDCVLRLTLRDNQPNLEITKKAAITYGFRGETAPSEAIVARSNPEDVLSTLTEFLSIAYDKDKVLRIENDVINKTFGVTYAIISDYVFTPKHGAGTYTFEFTLVEVDFEANVLSIPEQ